MGYRAYGYDTFILGLERYKKDSLDNTILKESITDRLR